MIYEVLDIILYNRQISDNIITNIYIVMDNNDYHVVYIFIIHERFENV